MGFQIFNLSLPRELVALINNQAKLNYMNRNEYIKQAIVIQLRYEGALNLEAAPSARSPVNSQNPAVVAIELPRPGYTPKQRQSVINASGLGAGHDSALENFLKEYEAEHPGSLDSVS